MLVLVPRMMLVLLLLRRVTRVAVTSFTSFKRSPHAASVLRPATSVRRRDGRRTESMSRIQSDDGVTSLREQVRFFAMGAARWRRRSGLHQKQHTSARRCCACVQLGAVIKRYASAAPSPAGAADPVAHPTQGVQPHQEDASACWAPQIQDLRAAMLGASSSHAPASGAGHHAGGAPPPQRPGEGPPTLLDVLRRSGDARAPHSAQSLAEALGLQGAFEAAAASAVLPCAPGAATAAAAGAAAAEGQQEAHWEAMRHGIKAHMNGAWSQEAVKQGVALAKSGKRRGTPRICRVFAPPRAHPPR